MVAPHNDEDQKQANIKRMSELHKNNYSCEGASIEAGALAPPVVPRSCRSSDCWV